MCGFQLYAKPFLQEIWWRPGPWCSERTLPCWNRTLRTCAHNRARWSDGQRHPRSHGPVAWPPNRILFKLQCRQFIELVRQLAAQPPGPQADEWLARTMAVGQQLQEAYFGKLTDVQQSALEVCGRRVRRHRPSRVWLTVTVAR